MKGAVLVTGGAGYIGSHMAHALLDDGARVIVLDDLSTGVRSAVPRTVELVVADVGNDSVLRDILKEHRIAAIAHFAGSSVIPESVAHPLACYENNTVKSLILIKTAIEAGVRSFLFSSTAAVYGEAKRPVVDETQRPEPISPYGRSKLMTEIMLRDAEAAHALRYVALRYFNVAGADPHGRTGQSTTRATHLIKRACQTALGQQSKLQIFGTDYPTPDGTCVRDYIHVTDLVDAHVLALRHLLAGGSSLTLNCGYGRGASVLEVVDAVRRVSGVDFPCEYSSRRAGDSAALIADARRIKEVLGWAPRYEALDTIVRHALAWEKRISLKPLLEAQS